MSESFLLGRRGQVHVGDLALGITATSPDPGDPAARMNITDRTSGRTETRVVRPGDEVRIGRHAITFSEVVPGTRDGHVAFTVDSMTYEAEPEAEHAAPASDDPGESEPPA
ncbi:hypothetical protein [Actinacidiphila oryziradicis]|uniref:hypothetical protein n=1 Tax=Actinacidiphila oryziradicis TaxID=2571141 RepID=UPI0023F3AB15|nr:hypothetical protein [Actinacidiphila oryziradicis]MCW2873054.1 hypothetical protein [Actinacidiphila oryziradicis]